MSNVLIEKQTMADIADAIREKLNTEATYKPSEMPDAIKSMSGTGGGTAGAPLKATGLISEFTARVVEKKGTYSVVTNDASSNYSININGIIYGYQEASQSPITINNALQLTYGSFNWKLAVLTDVINADDGKLYTANSVISWYYTASVNMTLYEYEL